MPLQLIPLFLEENQAGSVRSSRRRTRPEQVMRGVMLSNDGPPCCKYTLGRVAVVGRDTLNTQENYTPKVSSKWSPHTLTFKNVIDRSDISEVSVGNWKRACGT